MLTPRDIIRLCVGKYPAFVGSEFRGEKFFPVEVRFGRPDTKLSLRELNEQIEKLTNEGHERNGFGYRIEWAERRIKGQGAQRLPTRVWFEERDDYLKFIQKKTEF